MGNFFRRGQPAPTSEEEIRRRQEEERQRAEIEREEFQRAEAERHRLNRERLLAISRAERRRVLEAERRRIQEEEEEAERRRRERVRRTQEIEEEEARLRAEEESRQISEEEELLPVPPTPQNVELIMYTQSPETINNPMIAIYPQSRLRGMRETRRVFIDIGTARELAEAIGIVNSLVPVDDVIADILMDIIGDDFLVGNSWFELLAYPEWLQPLQPAQPLRAPQLLPPGMIGRPPVSPFTESEAGRYQTFGSSVSPYLHFQDPPLTEHEVCIINILFSKYTTCHNHITKKRILSFFGDPIDPSINNLIRFFKHYDISYEIYDIVGAKMYSGIGDSRNRPAIALMIFNHHAWLYDKSLKEKLDFSQTYVHSVDGWFRPGKDTRVKSPKETYIPGMGKAQPNFSYKCEAKCMPRPFFWQDNDHIGETVMGRDVNKAYYSSVMRCPANLPVGIFTLFDEIVPFDPEEKIDHAAMYFLTENGDWRTKCYWRTTNVLLGFAVEYELDMGRLTFQDITHVRRPTYRAPCTILQEKFHTERENFSIHFGRLGIRRRGARYVKVNMQEDDLRLLMRHHSDLKAEQINFDRGKEAWSAYLSISKEQWLYWNNFNWHSFVIESNNYFFTLKLDETLKRNPDLKPVKICVDFMAFDKDYFDDDHLKAEADSIYNFKEESIVIKKRKHNFQYVNPVELWKNMCDEFDEYVVGTEFTIGPAGGGKTTLVKSEDLHDHQGSFTNRASRNIDGETLHRMLLLTHPKDIRKSLRKYRDSTLWLDEFGQIPAWIHGALFMGIIEYNIHLLLTGDQYQGRPFNETPDYKSHMWSRLLEAARIVNDQHRYSGELLEICTAWRTSMEQGIPMPELDKKLFKEKFDHTIEHHLTLSHVCRRLINDAILQRRGITFNPPSLGLKVICRMSDKNRTILKGDIYYVVNHWEGGPTLMAERDQRYVPLELGNYLTYFEPGYATTIDSSQGLNPKGKVAVYEIDLILRLPYAKHRIYQAITRPTRIDNLILYHGTTTDLPEISYGGRKREVFARLKERVEDAIQCSWTPLTSVTEPRESSEIWKDWQFSPPGTIWSESVENGYILYRPIYGNETEVPLYDENYYDRIALDFLSYPEPLRSKLLMAIEQGISKHRSSWSTCTICKNVVEDFEECTWVMRKPVCFTCLPHAEHLGRIHKPVEIPQPQICSKCKHTTTDYTGDTCFPCILSPKSHIIAVEAPPTSRPKQDHVPNTCVTCRKKCLESLSINSKCPKCFSSLSLADQQSEIDKWKGRRS